MTPGSSHHGLEARATRQMQLERAYTYVDAGSARAGNRWAERRWSAFLGQTVEVQFPSHQWEWTSSPSPEFEIQCEGRALGFMDLGTVEWSEECDSFGATLVAAYTGGVLELATRCTFFHYHPGARRRWLLYNGGATSLKVPELRLDILAVRSDTVVVEQVDEHVAVARTFGKTVVFQAAPPARVELKRGGTLCAQWKPEGLEVASGGQFLLPETRMLFSQGTPDQVLQKEWPQFVQHLEQYAEAEEEAVRLRRGERER